MRNMFTMMNMARVGVGMEGVAIGERAFQQAPPPCPREGPGPLHRWRVQDERSNRRTPRCPSNAAHHEGLRRAMRSLLYLTAPRLTTSSMPTARIDASSPRSPRLAHLIVKACTDVGVEIASLGVQVHGGMGYIEETGAAQFLRDSRIAPIYEGTNGIQAIDLVLKIPLENGAVGWRDRRDDRRTGRDGGPRPAGRLPRAAVGRHPGSGRDLEMARRAARRRRSPWRRWPVHRHI